MYGMYKQHVNRVGTNVESLKREYFSLSFPLGFMYEFSKEEYIHLSDKELEEIFPNYAVALRKKYPLVSTTLKYKGMLRISWSFDMKYNKNIDLIFFPEDNPYINYVVLFAKDFPKTMIKEDAYIFTDREAIDVTISPNINYGFVKTILSQSDLSKYQQEKFFQVRFGSVFIPMEIEFEWYGLYIADVRAEQQYSSTIKSLLHIAPNIVDSFSAYLFLGIIKSHKRLPTNTPINFPLYIAPWQKNEYNKTTLLYEEVTKHLQIFTPLPTTALATTQTNMGDYLVNVRDKPNAKEGKIVAQLSPDIVKRPSDFCNDYSYSSPNRDKPLYQTMVKKGQEWYEEDNPGMDTDTLGYIEYYLYKTKLSYFQKEKQKLINPLYADDYLIFVWNIDSNNWAKVWVLRMIRDSDTAVIDGKTKLFKEFREDTDFDKFFFFLNGSYKQTFLQSPSTLKLYEGYIHVSNLEYLYPFGENYIRK